MKKVKRFNRGDSYYVLKELPNLHGVSPEVGDTVIFERKSYSHYDSATVYFFHGVDDEEYSVMWSDNEPDIRDYFERC